MRKLFLIFFLTGLHVAEGVYAQQVPLKGDNSFKLTVGMSGFGGSYEFNPVKNSFFELGASTWYEASRYGLQGKYALVNKEKFKLKAGLDLSGFYFLGGGKFGFLAGLKHSVMPHISIDGNELGLQCAVFSYSDGGNRKYLPFFTLSLNVTHSRKKDLESGKRQY